MSAMLSRLAPVIQEQIRSLPDLDHITLYSPLYGRVSREGRVDPVPPAGCRAPHAVCTPWCYEWTMNSGVSKP